MEYLIGSLIGLAVGCFGAVAGFDRDRAFYPTAMIVIAAYYPLFATIGASGATLTIEVVIALAFSAVATLGFKRNMWLVAAAIAGHGVFDLLGHGFIESPGMPVWWPGFCAMADLVIGGWLAVKLYRDAASHSVAIETSSAAGSQ